MITSLKMKILNCSRSKNYVTHKFLIYKIHIPTHIHHFGVEDDEDDDDDIYTRIHPQHVYFIRKAQNDFVN